MYAIKHSVNEKIKKDFLSLTYVCGLESNCTFIRRCVRELYILSG